VRPKHATKPPRDTGGQLPLTSHAAVQRLRASKSPGPKIPISRQNSRSRPANSGSHADATHNAGVAPLSSPDSSRLEVSVEARPATRGMLMLPAAVGVAARVAAGKHWPKRLRERRSTRSLGIFARVGRTDIHHCGSLPSVARHRPSSLRRESRTYTSRATPCRA